MAATDRIEDLRILTCTFRTFESWNHPNLSAPYWRVYWNDRPGWVASLGRSHVALAPGHLVVVPPETPFTASSSCPSGHLYIHFVAAQPFTQLPPALSVCALDEHLSTVVSELVGLSTSNREGDPRARVLAMVLCWEALRTVPDGLWPRADTDSRVSRAMRTMELMMERRTTNEQLASEAGMNTNAFIRLFRDQSGFSPQAWYARARVDHACRLLHHSALSVDQVAQRTGFCDRAHFSRVFARQRGIGPGEFRKRGVGA